MSAVNGHGEEAFAVFERSDVQVGGLGVLFERDDEVFGEQRCELTAEACAASLYHTHVDAFAAVPGLWSGFLGVVVARAPRRAVVAAGGGGNGHGGPFCGGRMEAVSSREIRRTRCGGESRDVWRFGFAGAAVLPPYCPQSNRDFGSGQKRDTAVNDEHLSLGPLPASGVEFGAGLRALRGVSLRELEARQAQGRGSLVLSKSQLQRYETGQLLPPLRYAAHLDDLYGADGWVRLSLSALHANTWDPWADEHTPAATHHAHDWPAPYRGSIWVLVKPVAENALRRHVLTLDWGVWSAALTLVVDADGQVLTTGKSADLSGVTVTFNLESDLPVYTLAGAGAPPSGYPVSRIHRKWRYGGVRQPLWRRLG